MITNDVTIRVQVSDADALTQKPNLGGRNDELLIVGPSDTLVECLRLSLSRLVLSSTAS